MVKKTLLLPLAIAGSLALAGCGSDSGGDGNAGDGPSTRNVADDKAELAFAKCMREAGINVSDPDGTGRIQMRLEGGGGEGTSVKKLQQASKDCRKKTGGGPREPTEAEKTEMRDQALKFAKCMRENGVDVPDPQFGGGGGITMTREAGARGIRPESPAFQKAQKACQDEMPMLRRGDGPSTSTSDDAGSGEGASATVEVPAP